MNRYACRYAIVQFMPYPETGEFANVGIILAIPQKNFFAFKLETQRATRLTQFFNHLERKVYISAIKGLEEELNFYLQTIKGGQITAQTAFESLIRPLETILRFSKERVKMVNTLQQVEEGLFNRFVMHDFAKTPDYEGELQRKITQMVREFNLEEKFRRQILGNATYSITMPLVQNKEKKVRAIQPLFFNQDKAQAIIDHGNRWIGKFDTLETFDALPSDILIPVKKPVKRTKDFNQAWGLIEKKLKNFGDVVLAGDSRSIKGFAQA